MGAKSQLRASSGRTSLIEKDTPLEKILHIITRLDMGGSAQNTISTCYGLLEKHYPVVLASGLSIESKMAANEARIVKMKASAVKKIGGNLVTLPTLVRRIDPFMDVLALVGLIELIRKEKPTIVHTHTSKAGILGRLAAWFMRVPVIVHTPHGHVFHGHFSRLLSKIFLIIERLFDKVTDCTIALTNGERDDYITKSVSKPDKFVKIHSGVGIHKFMNIGCDGRALKESLGIGNNHRVVGMVGWLLPIKGPVHLLEAMQLVWQNHPDTWLMFVGKGDLEAELKERAQKSGYRKKVKFLGWRDDIHEIMPVFDVFVLPSLNEGMGRVIVEAMAAGKPVVASRTGGIPDLVAEGETGLLVNPGDSDGLASAISHLLDNPALRHEMGREGRRRCHQFSEELMVEKIDRLYQELLD